MANLKSELDEYLNKGQQNRPKNNGHIPKVLKKLLHNESGEQTEKLLDSATCKTYFNLPSLVSYNKDGVFSSPIELTRNRRK